MNVLVINGSPKGIKSNTYQLTQAFIRGLQANEPVQLEVLPVNKLDIRPCLGCFSCWSKTPGKCCLSDDMSSVIEKLLWADVTIWSFPLYYFGVPGPLKNLMDRQLPMAEPFMTRDSVSGGHPSRYDVSGKKTVVISTCGFYTAQGNYEGVTAMFDHLCGKGNYTSIFCGQGELFRVPELKERTGEYLAFVEQAGREFLGGISQKTRNGLQQLLFPREVFEKMADASWGVDPKSGEKEDESLVFTRQMAALYQPMAYSGKDIVLEMHYTDVSSTYQILLTKEGSRVLTEEFLPYTTRIETPYALWRDIGAGKVKGEQALMEQKYRVLGNFDLMLKWDHYFGGHREDAPAKAESNSKSTDMKLLLLPWMAQWIGASIDPIIGSLICIAVCALLPLIFLRNRKTVYDSISGAAVCLCAVGILAGLPASIVLPVSYLCFGIMWTVGGLRKIPLTAHYSMNDYDGEIALENPLFIKTNRILTLMWGVLYLLIPVWTFFFLGTNLESVVLTVNSLLPAAMGIFTVWFQKWYPAWVARGK